MSGRARLLVTAGAVGLCVVVLAALAWGLGHPANRSPSVLGKAAPDLAITTSDGATVRLSQLRGKPVVLNFWASWCAPCRQEAPTLKQAFEARRGRVAFLGVDFQDSPQAARAFEQEVGFPYPVGPAVGGVPAGYAVDAPPDTFFIDSRGVVTAEFVGPLDGPAIDRYLQLVGAR
jgi:cytochrome c biogenesis protein CcmG/thiol:disulfide interchange protein DsbE